MTADFSRIRMNPLAALAGVELQQGRVLLDADFNEQVAVVDRRLRALASDVLGRATVSQTTTDAFHLTPAGAGFTIGRGRMYVDGLLAENFGRALAAERIFDPLLSETVYSQDPSYAEQPWLQPAPALPTGGRHLVYLDVWERELTAVELPSLVEPALGVDASTRRQTVWQVRVLADEAPATVDCSSPDTAIPGWAALIAPSTGRLTTGTFDVSAVPDPCELPPTGGYTGLENQLYRVEVHDAGAPGAGATFKWSRDNASVATRVATVVSATELELDSLGRDEVLRFAVGHWIEITDDRREFARAPGEMRKIAEIDEASRRVRFTPALPADMLPATLPDSTQAEALNLRVRRWDQAGEIVRTAANGTVVVVQDLDAPGSTGVIAIPAAGTTLLLENGVTVSFSSVGAKGFRSGDAWVFAARTADASVEPLAEAAPRAIHHHYARLGFWDLAAGTISDCRGKWPPAGGDDCSCTACVTEESHANGSFTIQDAVDQVRAAGGGTVCIGIGSFALEQPVQVIDAVSLRIQGQGAGSVVIAPATAFDIRGAIAMALDQLTIVCVDDSSAVVVSSALGLALTRLVVACVGSGETPGAAIALAGAVLAARIEGNLLLAPLGVRALEPRAKGSAEFLFCADLAIEDNILWCERSAVLLAGPVFHMLETRVSGNQVLGCSATALSLLGASAPGSAARVERNTVQSTGGGVAACLDGLWIADNKLESSGGAAGANGIELRGGFDASGVSQCQILANQLRGYAGAAIALRLPAAALVVKLNLIDRCANGIVMQDDAQSDALAIENNQLRDLGPADPRAGADTVLGVALSRVLGAVVAGNQLRRVGAETPESPLRAGVFALAATRLRVTGNDIVESAPSADFSGRAAGVFVGGPFLQLDVQHNRIERDAVPLAEASRSTWIALFAGTATFASDSASDAIGPVRFGRLAAVPFEGGATLVLNGSKGYVAAALAGGSSVGVLGNGLVGRGIAQSVLVFAARECLFTDNRCEHQSAGAPAISLTTPVAIINGNRVRNNSDVSIVVENSTKSVAAVANITSGIIQAPGMGSQFAPLNLRG